MGFRGQSYKLVGFAMNAHKFCIEAERYDGKVFRFPRNVLTGIVRAKIAA